MVNNFSGWQGVRGQGEKDLEGQGVKGVWRGGREGGGDREEKTRRGGQDGGGRGRGPRRGQRERVW